MIRILGVISGAAISIAALTWFVGVPQFTTERVVSEAPVSVGPLYRGEIKLPAPLAPPEDAATDTVSHANAAAALPEATEAVVAPDPVPVDDDALVAQSAAEAPVDAETPDVPIDLATDLLREPNWFAFWSPFRSEIAANGFVGELQRVTGLDYRVVKIKPGVYEVAFAYSDNDEINSNLSTISAATGLNLPGGQ